jgi:hypothetical protein
VDRRARRGARLPVSATPALASALSFSDNRASVSRPMHVISHCSKLAEDINVKISYQIASDVPTPVWVDGGMYAISSPD